MLFFIFGRCPKNCSIARKNYFARLWGAAAPNPPAHTTMLQVQAEYASRTAINFAVTRI